MTTTKPVAESTDSGTGLWRNWITFNYPSYLSTVAWASHLNVVR